MEALKENNGLSLNHCLETIAGRVIKAKRKLYMSVLLASLAILSACASPVPQEQNGVNYQATRDFVVNSANELVEKYTSGNENDVEQFVQKNPRIAKSSVFLTISYTNPLTGDLLETSCSGGIIQAEGKNWLITATHCIPSYVKGISISRPHLSEEPIYNMPLDDTQVTDSNRHSDIFVLPIPEGIVENPLPLSPRMPQNTVASFISFPTPTGDISSMVTVTGENLPLVQGNETMLHAPLTIGGSGTVITGINSDGEPVAIGIAHTIGINEGEPSIKISRPEDIWSHIHRQINNN